MRSSRMALAAAAVLGLALAGCGDDEQPSPEPSPDQTTAPATPAPTGQVASCLVGDWRSTGIGERAGGEVAGLRLSGGSGIGLSIGQDGTSSLDFAQMEPIGFTGEVAGADVDGALGYSGQAAGTVHTGGDAESGTWEPEEIDWSGVRITLDLTEPVESRPLDNAPLGEPAEEIDQWTGDMLDVEPVLSEGTYECQDDTTLVLTSGDDTGLTWTFTRE